MHIKDKNTELLKHFVQDHLSEDPAQLLLKYHHSVPFDLKLAVQQIAARQKAKYKIPTWAVHPDIIFPVSLSMEQSSSELTAKHKATFMKGENLVDLTGGLGVDTFFASDHFEKATYIERNQDLCEIAENNLVLLAPGKFHVYHGDAIKFLSSKEQSFDWLYVDPARRGDQNQKLYKLSDCEPDVVANWPLFKSKAKNILVKASPMLDISAVLDEIPEIQKVIVVAVKNEVKEVLLVYQQGSDIGNAIVECVELSAGNEGMFSFDYLKEANLDLQLSYPKRFIIEPHATILKAGGFKSFSEQYQLPKIHVNSHLYTSDHSHRKILGKIYEIIGEIKADKKQIKSLFPSGKANVVVRNHPMKAEVIKSKFRLQDGGEDFLIASTTQDGKPRFFHCRKVI